MRCLCTFATAVLMVAVSARAITVDFTSTLNGANERPDPVDTPATGTATGQLTGDPGLFVFTYSIQYSGLTGPATVGHIHDPGAAASEPFTEAVGPPVHDLPSLDSPINGVWSYTDLAQPLTDELAAALQAGRLYINIHSDLFPNGEIRGQLEPVIVPPPPPPPPGVIPLPPAVWTGLITMAGSTFAAWRMRRGI